MTIEVPELLELKQALRLLELFQKVQIDNKDFDEYYNALKLESLGLDKFYCKNELEKFTNYLKNNGAITLKQMKKLSKFK